jgi:hypothetical protein
VKVNLIVSVSGQNFVKVRGNTTLVGVDVFLLVPFVLGVYFDRKC